MPSKPSKIRQPELNDRRVFDFVKSQKVPVSFHIISKSLNMTSGAVQATVDRLTIPDSNYRIYEGKEISKNRIIRVFSINSSKVSLLNLPNLSKIVDIYENIISGNVFEVENNFFLPLKMDEQTTQILSELVKISPNLESMGDLFSKALEKYLEESISKGLIDQAKQKVEEN